jgi:ASC-1-like (ASCH) protein
VWLVGELLTDPKRFFREMFDHECVASVNPLATREEQLANIRQIYPPEREALGVVAIGIELVGPPRPA